MTLNTIHPREMQAIIEKKHAVVVDIREQEAYRTYHYKNAVNIPYKEDACWLSHFSGRRVWIFYCEHGNTSLLAARRLGREGCEVYTVIGGAHAIKEYFL